MHTYFTAGAYHERAGPLYAWALPRDSRNGAIVSIAVSPNHPLLQLKRALPWEALCEVMTRHWRRAGKIAAPVCQSDVALYVPLVVLMVVKHLNSREMEAYLAENVVARLFIGRQDDPQLQVRTTPTSLAPIQPWQRRGGGDQYVDTACGQGLWLCRCQSPSSDTTAQELPIGYPNEPGILRARAALWARLGEAQNPRGGGHRASTRTGADDPQDGQRTSPVCQGQADKRQVLTRLFYEVCSNRWSRHASWCKARRASRPCDPQRDHHLAHHARGGQAPHSADRAVDHDWGGRQRQSLRAAIVRHKAARTSSLACPICSVAWVVAMFLDGAPRSKPTSRRCPCRPWRPTAPSLGARYTHADGLRPGGYATATLRALPAKGSRRLAFSRHGRGSLPRPSARRCAASVARPKGSLAL